MKIVSSIRTCQSGACFAGQLVEEIAGVSEIRIVRESLLTMHDPPAVGDER
jgi:hypothetical protein